VQGDGRKAPILRRRHLVIVQAWILGSHPSLRSGLPEDDEETAVGKKSLHTRKTSPILSAPETEDRMAGWDGEANWDRYALEHIAALLFALAGLADLAAGAPFLRRRRVLGILGWGEAEARAFLIGMATGVPVAADELEPAQDAARLAANFRGLALLLCAMLARFALSSEAGSRARRPSRGTSGPAVRRLDAPPAPDTS
jgi:hypothetical protein